ncbi:hypothetical protein PoB_006342900 [Plakobranchus ocellatus]|uniref:Uncharacterized protein n=1 Tax=Plakobranchus ocellatus TaxID=259542 RepID=A0AAV4CYB2_9GAST|nr:hypothetical protein PoB_006342900 [Plakobranchus ocellatus]
MISYIAVLTLVLGVSQAQNNITCCPPNFAGLGYNALLDFQFDYYYDAETGDSLELSKRGNISILFESSTGSTYTRQGEHCILQVTPEYVVSSLCY